MEGSNTTIADSANLNYVPIVVPTTTIQPIQQPITFQQQAQPQFNPPVYNNINVNYQLKSNSKILNPSRTDIFNKSIKNASGTAAGFIFENDDGVTKSSDAGLDNQYNILQFLQSHMVAPSESIRVYGSHTESYSDTETDSDGNSRSVTRTRTVTDFYYHISITDYINPIGTMLQPHAEIDRYLASKANLKELKMEKRIHWDHKYIKEAIIQRIRALGYTDDVDIQFVSFNDRVKIYPNNTCADCARNDCFKALCFLTCLCIIWYPIKWCLQAEPGIIYCDYNMSISPQDWFNRHIHLIKIK